MRSPAARFTQTVAVAASLLIAAVPSAKAQTQTDWEGDLRTSLNQMADRLTATLKPWDVPARTFRVEEYGAVADGKTLNTASIKKAVDACAAQGGGVVLFGKGDYATGTFDLRSGVMLEVAAGAKILGSTSAADYVRRPAAGHEPSGRDALARGLIVAEGCERVGIRGAGEIDGRGREKSFPSSSKERPKLLYFADCKKVVIDGITLRNSAFWMQHYLNCDDLIIQNETVDDQANRNNDGIDVDGCRNVIVRHCYVNSEDDGMCFKGTDRWTMENVLVEDCKFYSTCNAIKNGTSSAGVFRNVLVRNVEAGGPAKEWPTFQHRPAESGIAWEVVDGGALENVLATNVHIVRATAPLFLRLGDRGEVPSNLPKPKPGSLRRVVFENITADAFGPSIFAGIPGSKIEDVVVRHLRVTLAAEGEGGRKEKATAEKAIAEKKSSYPNPPMFGHVPAYGFWLRHVSAVRFVDLAITPAAAEPFPCFASDRDVDGVTVDGNPLR